MAAKKEVPVSAKQESDEFVRIFNERWNDFEPRTDFAMTEQPQIKALLEPYLSKVFGGNEHQYTVGFFLERDIPGMQAIGYVPLTIGKFPRDTNNKPLWNDSIAARMRLYNHADGTVRWGSRGELIVCFVKREIRGKVAQAKAEASEKRYGQVLNPRPESVDVDGTTTEVEIGKERISAPRPGTRPRV